MCHLLRVTSSTGINLSFTLYAFTLYSFDGITSRGYRAFNAAYIQVIYMNWRFMLKIIALTRYISGAFKNDS